MRIKGDTVSRKGEKSQREKRNKRLRKEQHGEKEMTDGQTVITSSRAQKRREGKEGQDNGRKMRRGNVRKGGQ